MSGIHLVGRAATALTLLLVAVAVTWLAAGLLSLPLLSQTTTASPGTTERILPITDPTRQPRLEFAELRYAGAFRLPSTDAGDTFASGGGPLAFNPARNSLFVGARSGKVAEVTLPEPARAGQIADLPAAEYLQGFEDPADGRMKDVAKDGAGLAGLLVHAGRLYGTGLIYYDATNSQAVSHFSRPLNLAEKGATPMRSVWNKGRAGFVAGYLAAVPAEWQTKLGGPAITGQCCQPIISRTSLGPAAFAWQPADLATKTELDAIPLVYYPSDHPTLGPWSGSNPTYGSTSQVNGLAIIAGRRTALFIGRNGTGPYCYGTGTGDQSLDQTIGTNGEKFCYDPASSDKGQHAYPYTYQMWAYDLNDLAEAAAGRRDAWSIKPYGVWPFELPYPEASARIGGVAYDAVQRRLFISQRAVHRDGYSYRPLIHVYQTP